MHILLAEDDKVSRELLRRIIQSEPEYTLTQACDGEEAWNLVRDPARRIDVCVFDICMPNLSGLEVVERIRADESVKEIPVILCTAVRDRQTVEHAATLAVTHYVVKPYSRTVMLEKLRQIRSELPNGEILERPDSACKRLGIEADMFRAMIESLLGDVGEWRERLKKPVPAIEAQKLFIRGRGFEGSCLSLGARRAARQFKSVETVIQNYLGQSGGPSEPLAPAATTAVLETLDQELQLVAEHLKAPAST